MSPREALDGCARRALRHLRAASCGTCPTNLSRRWTSFRRRHTERKEEHVQLRMIARSRSTTITASATEKISRAELPLVIERNLVPRSPPCDRHVVLLRLHALRSQTSSESFGTSPPGTLVNTKGRLQLGVPSQSCHPHLLDPMPTEILIANFDTGCHVAMSKPRGRHLGLLHPGKPSFGEGALQCAVS